MEALAYDAKNHLVSVTGAATASFVYDADGKQVKATVNGVTTYGACPEPRRRVGNHYIIPLWDEVKSGVVTKYYFAGTTRLAVRTGGTLSYLLADHIGSSSVTTDANGAKTATALYKAFGETRYTLGTLGTDYKFTGQREEASLGIYFFVARWFDPSLGRFLSPDSIVPTSTQGTQAWDRYAFVNNNPVRYTDPTGHKATNDDGGCTSYADCHPDHAARILLFIELARIEIESMDPFAGPLESPQDYLDADQQYAFAFFADVYEQNGVNLNAIGRDGLENPLDFASIDNDPGAYGYLFSRVYFAPYKFFLEELGLNPGNPFNYEPHYLNALMMYHRDELLRAEFAYYQWLEELGCEDTDDYEDNYRFVNEQLEEGPGD